MAKTKSAGTWPVALRKYIINQLALWIPYVDIWSTVTNSRFTEVTGLSTLDPEVHTYDRFRMRCRRIPKHEIALAHDDWQQETGAIKWAEDKARIQGLSDLIDTVHAYINEKEFDKDTTGTLAALVGQMRNLYEQIRKEVQIDADRAALSASGTRILLANPKNITISGDYISELILICREEIGGVHKLDFLGELTTSELQQLHDRCLEVINARVLEITHSAVDGYYEEEDDEDEDV